jgi:hypothetical protein
MPSDQRREIHGGAAVNLSACETVKFCRLEDSPDCLRTDSGDSADVDSGAVDACAKVCVLLLFYVIRFERFGISLMIMRADNQPIFMR